MRAWPVVLEVGGRFTYTQLLRSLKRERFACELGTADKSVKLSVSSFGPLLPTVLVCHGAAWALVLKLLYDGLWTRAVGRFVHYEAGHGVAVEA